jgi:hypothetical protein
MAFGSPPGPPGTHVRETTGGGQPLRLPRSVLRSAFLHGVTVCCDRTSEVCTYAKYAQPKSSGRLLAQPVIVVSVTCV